jgi:UDP-3-O-acyl-N-acetylglucosamine deacetylase
MSAKQPWGIVLAGDQPEVRRSYERWLAQPVDVDMLSDPGEPFEPKRTTLSRAVSVTGPGTFLGRAQRTLTFEPCERPGWFFDRLDLPDSLPIAVSVNEVWTTARNIVLCSGSPHNYMRMVEHIVALKVGMGLDNVMIRMDSGDPPLFDRSSLDLVEAVESAGIVPLDREAPVLTVREPVTVGGRNGSFLTLLPSDDGSKRLTLDCAIHFKSAIGKQRIRFPVTRENFVHGAAARTNTTLLKVLYCRTVGKIFADVRNLGYTTRNILVAGRWRYLNEPRLMHNGKSLEAAWHRATLDLLAALALIDRGRLAGHAVSYKAGHALDVTMVRELYRRDLRVPV